MPEPRADGHYAEKWLPGITPLSSVQQQQNPRNSNDTLPHAQTLRALQLDPSSARRSDDRQRNSQNTVSHMMNGWIITAWNVFKRTTMLGQTQTYGTLTLDMDIISCVCWTISWKVVSPNENLMLKCHKFVILQRQHVISICMFSVNRWWRCTRLRDLPILRQTRECEKKVLP